MKTTINVGGKVINVNTTQKNVAACLQNLINALTERRFAVGSCLRHSSGARYQIARILMANGSLHAKLINTVTGKARNSTKVVLVKTDDADYPNGYVTDLPAVKDKFWDPENAGQYIGDLN
jgi:hypothetical protein